MYEMRKSSRPENSWLRIPVILQTRTWTIALNVVLPTPLWRLFPEGPPSSFWPYSFFRSWFPGEECDATVVCTPGGPDSSIRNSGGAVQPDYRLHRPTMRYLSVISTRPLACR